MKKCQRKKHAAAAFLAIFGVFGVQAAAGASDPEPSTDAGALIAECGANDDFLTLFGQVWDDVDRDGRLLEDSGIAGVQVALAGGAEVQQTETDESGFWAYCLGIDEAAGLTSASVSFALPEVRTPVTPGVGDEDQDSDVEASEFDGAGRVIEASTQQFSVVDEITGRNRQFESSQETLTIRIDAGLATSVLANPCPDWNVELVELDSTTDWDEDGIPNADDSAPCERGIANPCPDWSARDLEFDPNGDWDGDGLLNAGDVDPCASVEPPQPNPCDNPNTDEIFELAQLSPTEDWDSDGLINALDATPCEPGLGDPCPDWQAIHLEEDPGGDWDDDGIANSDDPLPCDREPPNPCPEWNRETAQAFPELDWDGDGVLNGDDPLPCDPPGNPCPDVNDLWIEQDPSSDWDGDGLSNANDPDPCVENIANPCPDLSDGLVEQDPLGDWDGDGIVNIEDGNPCDADVESPCPDWSEEDREQDPIRDWDGDGIVNIEDDEPCDESVVVLCPEFTDEQMESDPLGDWDDDGTPNAEDEDPCVPMVSGDVQRGADPSRRYSIAVAAVAVVLVGALVAIARGIRREKKVESRPTAHIGQSSTKNPGDETDYEDDNFFCPSNCDADSKLEGKRSPADDYGVVAKSASYEKIEPKNTKKCKHPEHSAGTHGYKICLHLPKSIHPGAKHGWLKIPCNILTNPTHFKRPHGSSCPSRPKKCEHPRHSCDTQSPSLLGKVEAQGRLAFAGKDSCPEYLKAIVKSHLRPVDGSAKLNTYFVNGINKGEQGADEQRGYIEEVFLPSGYEVRLIHNKHELFLGDVVQLQRTYSWANRGTSAPLQSRCSLAVLGILHLGMEGNYPVNLIGSSGGTLHTFNAVYAFMSISPAHAAYLKNNVQMLHLGCLVHRSFWPALHANLKKYENHIDKRDPFARAFSGLAFRLTKTGVLKPALDYTAACSGLLWIKAIGQLILHSKQGVYHAVANNYMRLEGRHTAPEVFE